MDHVITVTTIVGCNPRRPADPGLYAVSCSCGWAPFEAFSFPESAEAAGDAHVAGGPDGS